jgi:GT2 family glycosyltransferase
MEVKKRIHKTICIILVNYNNNKDTIDCVHSIMESDYPELPFIVVVDNSEQISGLKESLSFYKNIIILFSGANLGFAGGNNSGIRWAFGNLTFDYLFILNNDTLVKKETLSKLVSYATDNHSVHLFTPCIITTDHPARIWYAGGTFNFSKMTPAVYHIGDLYNDVKLSDSPTEFASGCALFVSAPFIDRHNNFFDPSFFMYDEDVEFSLRMKNFSIPIHFVCRSIVIHKCQGSQSPDTDKTINQLSPNSENLIFYLKHTIKNRYYITGKHFTGIVKLRINIKLTFYWFAKCVQYLLYLRLKAALIVALEILKSIFGSQPGK